MFIILNIVIFITTLPFVDTIHRELTVAGLLVLVMFLFLLVEYLFIFNGLEWVYATNWMYQHEGIIQSKHNICLSNQISVRQILNVLTMILAGKKIKIAFAKNYILHEYILTFDILNRFKTRSRLDWNTIQLHRNFLPIL